MSHVRHAGQDAARLIDRIVNQSPASTRLIVLARRLPVGLERLRRAEALQLDASDLGLRLEETLALCRTGFGLAVSGIQAQALHASTAGWTAATVLAASRVKRGAQSIDDLTEVSGASPSGIGRRAWRGGGDPHNFGNPGRRRRDVR